eukprot:3110451-Alexandrium_andersonii.AAC.1
MALPPGGPTKCIPVHVQMGDPREVVPKYLPWLPCRNIEVPDWWCGKCHRSELSYSSLVDRECPVGRAAT